MRDPRAFEPNSIHLIPLGIGNAFTRYYFNTSMLLILGGKTIMIDAPAPLRRVLYEAEKTSGVALDLDVIDHVYLTHLHGDHCSGLEELGFWRMFVESRLPKPTIHLLDQLKDPLWFQRLFAPMGYLDNDQGTHEMSLEDYFQVQTFKEGDSQDFGIEGLTIQPRLTNHMVPTAAFRLRFQGVSIGYSSDTAFDPSLIDFFADCDVIFHEAGVGKIHTSLEELLRLPEEIRRRMHLYHINDGHHVETSPIPVLKQGALYRVTASERADGGLKLAN